MRATYTFGERSIKQLAKVHPTFVEILKTALASPKCPWDITITDGARTLAEQRKLYAQGRTTPGNIVTWTKPENSKHLIQADGYGHAVDFIVCGYSDFSGNYKKFTTSKDIYKRDRLKEFAKHVIETARQMGYKVEWGGSWKTDDSPHLQFIGKL